MLLNLQKDIHFVYLLFVKGTGQRPKFEYILCVSVCDRQGCRKSYRFSWKIVFHKKGQLKPLCLIKRGQKLSILLAMEDCNIFLAKGRFSLNNVIGRATRREFSCKSSNKHRLWTTNENRFALAFSTSEFHRISDVLFLFKVTELLIFVPFQEGHLCLSSCLSCLSQSGPGTTPFLCPLLEGPHVSPQLMS